MSVAAVNRIFQILSDETLIRISSIVIILVIFVPLLDYKSIDNSFYSFIDHLKIIAVSEKVTNFQIQLVANEFEHFYYNKDVKLAYLKVESPWLSNSYEKTFHNFRNVARKENIKTIISSYIISNSTSDQNFVHKNLFNSNTLAKTVTNFLITAKIDKTVQTQKIYLSIIYTLLLPVFLLFFYTASITNKCYNLTVKPLDQAIKNIKSNISTMMKAMQNISHNSIQTLNKKNKDETLEKKRKSITSRIISGGSYDFQVEVAELENDLDFDMLDNLTTKCFFFMFKFYFYIFVSFF
jgi:hypothetical protein